MRPRPPPWRGALRVALMPSAAADRSVPGPFRGAPWRSRGGLAAAGLAMALAQVGPAAALPAATQPGAALPRVPRVVEVPFRPAFVRPPGGGEVPARVGQVLAPASLIRTASPGRLQVLLADGRQFRLGGDALLRLAPEGLRLLRGQIIAWVNPGRSVAAPLRIRTRMVTASIVGTTVFIEASDDRLTLLSWEGKVRVETDDGRRYLLGGGEVLTLEGQSWQAPRRLSVSEAVTRRRASILLNGFATPMETLPLIERELGIRSASPSLSPAR